MSTTDQTEDTSNPGSEVGDDMPRQSDGGTGPYRDLKGDDAPPFDQSTEEPVEKDDFEIEESQDSVVSSNPSHPPRFPEYKISSWLSSVTSQGLFPVVAHGLDPRGQPDALGVVTCPIVDFPLCIRLVEKINDEPVNIYRFIPLGRLERVIAEKNAVMTYKDERFQGFNSEDPEHRRRLSWLLQYHTACKWSARSFILMDIVEFSLNQVPEQMALRMSLGQTISQCMRRLNKLADKNVIDPKAVKGFNRISTGDGFYVWPFDSSTEGHVALFTLLVLIATRIRSLQEAKQSTIRLRMGFGIGEAYTFPYHGPGFVPTNAMEGFMPDAIGPVLNDLQRVISKAAPNQILVMPFTEPGRNSRPGEILDVQTMLTRIKQEILPAELEPADWLKSQDIELNIDPNKMLWLSDKHGEAHHCYNVHGVIPNRPVRSVLEKKSIGLMLDEALDIDRTHFK